MYRHIDIIIMDLSSTLYRHDFELLKCRVTNLFCIPFLTPGPLLHSSPPAHIQYLSTMGVILMPPNYLNMPLDFLAVACLWKIEWTVCIIMSASSLSPIFNSHSVIKNKRRIWWIIVYTDCYKTTYYIQIIELMTTHISHSSEEEGFYHTTLSTNQQYQNYLF